MFSTVRDCEVNIKRYRGSAMSQRWLASVILYCEKGFRRIKGYDQIAGVVEAIEREQGDAVSVPRKGTKDEWEPQKLRLKIDKLQR